MFAEFVGSYAPWEIMEIYPCLDFSEVFDEINAHAVRHACEFSRITGKVVNRLIEFRVQNEMIQRRTHALVTVGLMVAL